MSYKEGVRNILLFVDYHVKMLAITIYYVFRALIFYKKTFIPECKGNRECIVLGNGPSLGDVLEKSRDSLLGRDVFCVNEFALSDYYQLIRPSHYVLVDPNYWRTSIPKRANERRLMLFSRIEDDTDWNMTLYVPHQAKRVIESEFENSNISICYINSNPVVGYEFIRNFIYRMNIGMPPAYNVLIAAIFCAIKSGYKYIYIYGADHSWHEEIIVGNDNVLYVKQKHFYDEDLALSPMNKGWEAVFRVHEAFLRWGNVFYSYVLLDSFAKHVGCKVYNLTKKTYIDSFERLNSSDE